MEIPFCNSKLLNDAEKSNALQDILFIFATFVFSEKKFNRIFSQNVDSSHFSSELRYFKFEAGFIIVII